jgi:hypothetical protein
MLAECGTGCADEVNQERHDWVVDALLRLARHDVAYQRDEGNRIDR